MVDGYLLGIYADDSIKFGRVADEDDDRREGTPELKSFCLPNKPGDLLMLPKDMLLERTVRKEFCPSIGLPLITRIPCNFTPDEVCSDSVPGILLEELILRWRTVKNDEMAVIFLRELQDLEKKFSS